MMLRKTVLHLFNKKNKYNGKCQNSNIFEWMYFHVMDFLKHHQFINVNIVIIIYVFLCHVHSFTHIFPSIQFRSYKTKRSPFTKSIFDDNMLATNKKMYKTIRAPYSYISSY